MNTEKNIHNMLNIDPDFEKAIEESMQEVIPNKRTHAVKASPRKRVARAKKISKVLEATRLAKLTLDVAQEAFEANPTSKTAKEYMQVANEYFSDGMITKQEVTRVVARCTGLESSGAYVGGEWKPNAVDSREYTGFSVSYYELDILHPVRPEKRKPYSVECYDIIEALGMSYSEGSLLKALWRMCAARQGKAKRGYIDAKYDAEKLVYSAKRILEETITPKGKKE